MKMPISDVRFGTPGHESEYTIHVKGYDCDIPRQISNFLENLLPDWCISNRGSRIEIMGRRSNSRYGDRDDVEVIPVIEAALRLYSDYRRIVWEEEPSFGILFLEPAMVASFLQHVLSVIDVEGQDEQFDELAALESRLDMNQPFCDEQLQEDVMELRERFTGLVNRVTVGEADELDLFSSPYQREQRRRMRDASCK